jgi:hypothetical protein
MTQTGSNVVFSDQGVVVTLHNTTLSEVSQCGFLA